MTIFSITHKIIIWMEETIPLEGNTVQAALRKTARYANLKAELLLKGWKVHDLTYEIGALGFVAKTFDTCFRKLGCPNKQRKYIRKRASKLALRSSYYIWTNRFTKKFFPPILAQIPDQHCFPPAANTILPAATTCMLTPLKSRKTTVLLPWNTPILPSPSPARKSGTPTKIHPLSTPPPLLHSPLPNPDPPSPKTPIPSTPPSSLSKLRAAVNAMTPPSPSSFAEYNAFSIEMRSWFDEKIPLYQVDCYFGIDPIKNSLKGWLPKKTSPPCDEPPFPVVASFEASKVAFAASSAITLLAKSASATPGFALLMAATTENENNIISAAATAATTAARCATAANSKASAAITAALLTKLSKSGDDPFLTLREEAHFVNKRSACDAAAAAASAAFRSAAKIASVAQAATAFVSLCQAIDIREPELENAYLEESSDDEKLKEWMDRKFLWPIKENTIYFL
jgi:hypothetical protein